MWEKWKPIKGYEGKYEVSFYGEVRRNYSKAPSKLLTAYEKKDRKGSRYLVVKLTDANRKSKEVKLAKVVYEAFGGRIPEGYCVAHKDASFTNNEFNNLVILTKEELGKKTGYQSRQKPVIKLTKDLEPVDIYRSAREAAKHNYMSYQTIIDRCNGKVKSLLAPDGYIYKWDEDINYEYAA